MTGSILEPWNKTIRITILGQPVDVPDNNLLLRCLQHLLPETVPYGRFCWNDECGNSEFRYRLPGDSEEGWNGPVASYRWRIWRLPPYRISSDRCWCRC
jgi:hypothetical protein